VEGFLINAKKVFGKNFKLGHYPQQVGVDRADQAEYDRATYYD
jgi:hypothetical protein